MKIIADENIPFVAECFSSIGNVEAVPAARITSRLIKDADILLVRSVTKVNSRLLSGSTVKFVGTATIGFEHIDTDFLKENNICFASAPGSNANSVAEYVVAALLEIAQKYNISLENKLTGIIGVGNVGSKVAEKCPALGMKTCLNDPPLKRKTADAKYLPMEKLLGCDFITLHVPLSFEGIDKTFHLADENFFKSLKKGCVFVNTSRGGVVDTAALKAAIKSNRLKATVLDVWENEPDIDTELLKMVDIATPHIAGYSTDGKIEGMIMVYKQACKYLGIETKFGAKDFLPAAYLGKIRLGPDSKNQQDIMLKTVREIYDIRRDDTEMRNILNMPDEKRAAFFSRLRKNYPVRREFGNTTIEMEKFDKSLAEKLSKIGFKVTNDKDQTR